MKFSLLLAVIPFVIALSASASDFDFEKEVAQIEEMARKEMAGIESEEGCESSEAELAELFKSGWARWENNHLILGNEAINIKTQQNGLKISASMSFCNIRIQDNSLICISGADFNSGVSVDLKLRGKEAIIRAYELSTAN